MLSLEEAATIDENWNDEFLESFKQPKTAKSLWGDMYFFLIGDPMKQKNNKIRDFIKKINEKKDELSPSLNSRKKHDYRSSSYIKFKKTSLKKVNFWNSKNISVKKSSAIRTSRKEVLLPRIEHEFRQLVKTELKQAVRLKSMLVFYNL